jgi:thiamine kinase-like enzyme
VPEGYDALAPAAGRVEAALTAEPEPLVPCHNDLLAANVLDDGGDLRFIDYEYSGMNESSFELGNLVNESQLDRDHLVELVEAYHGTATPRVVARAELWGLAGRWAWTLWGAIQHGVSDVDHDFWDFAMERFEPARSLMTSRRLDDLLDAAGSHP